MSHHGQSLRDETWLPTQEIQNFYQQVDLAVRELLDCISLCTLKTCSIRILHGSLGVVDLPIKLLDASQSLILIPPGLCTSKEVSSYFNKTTRLTTYVLELAEVP